MNTILKYLNVCYYILYNYFETKFPKSAMGSRYNAVSLIGFIFIIQIFFLVNNGLVSAYFLWFPFLLFAYLLAFYRKIDREFEIIMIDISPVTIKIISYLWIADILFSLYLFCKMAW